MSNTPKKKLYIKTWGCQMNVYDSHRMADVLRPLGYDSVETPDDADMLVLNTCHIREKATDKVFSELGRLREIKNARDDQGKKTLIAVAGCVAQAEGDVITTRAPYVDLVFGPQTYAHLPEMVLAANGGARVINTDFPVEPKFDTLPSTTQSQGPCAFLSIQEGCDKFCTFCVVPYTRGAEFSRPPEQIIAEAEAIVASGARDITLLGQNVNAYHGIAANGATWNLARLIQGIAGVKGIDRIRYMTSHPRDCDAALMAAHRDIPQLMPFLHLPVQSGSDKILAAMNRKHTVQEYRQIIANFRAHRPDIGISSDFIIGFPGETDDDHRATLDLINDIGFSSAYSFKYSARPGTPAAAMGGLVPEHVAQARLQEIQSAINASGLKFNQGFMERTVPVLFDRFDPKTGQLHGRTPHNQPAHTTGSARLVGQVIDIKVKKVTGTALEGNI